MSENDFGSPSQTSETSSSSAGGFSPRDLEKELQRMLDSRGRLSEILTFWQNRDAEKWTRSPTLYVQLGQGLLNKGEPLLAYDVLAEGSLNWPEDRRMWQLLSLALARSGATMRAEGILSELRKDDPRDEETLGIMARVYKDLWQRSTDASVRRRYLRQALDTYADAYRLTGGYWSGINAATLALIGGNREKAHRLARQVVRQCKEEIEREEESGADLYWPLATLGEAALILDDAKGAEEWYSRAAELGRGRWGDLGSTRRNASLILDFLGIDAGWLHRLLNLPNVVVFTGHMLDAPDRQNPRFPQSLADSVYRELLDRLKRLGSPIGYASAACGADILFLEAIRKLGGDIHIILPFNRDDFELESVRFAGPDWSSRFRRLLETAAEVCEASSERAGSAGAAFHYGNLVLFGLAKIRANHLDTGLVPMAVWDPESEAKAGGAGSLIALWRESGLTVEAIDLNTLRAPSIQSHSAELPVRDHSIQVEPAGSADGEPPRQDYSAVIRAILFADLVYFSKLAEEQLPRFVEHFLGTVARLIEECRHPPEIKNTWGDGLYFAFHSVRHAGTFALTLQSTVETIDWSRWGLPRELNLRIGLHAGPVYSCVDPVTRKHTYIGQHVSQTARIEPVTPPGQVYASQAFAAIAASENVAEFRCEYVGQTPLAKGFGSFPTYHLSPVEPAPGS